jgi:hypothetical protein
MADLILKKGGKLIRSYIQESGKKKLEDVSKISHECLFENCTLDKDIKLKDIFLLMKMNINKYDKLIGNWCKKIVINGLSKTYKINRKKDKMDYLVLQFNLEQDFEDNEEYCSTNGLAFPHFFGIEIAKKDFENGKKGDIKESYAIEFSPPYELASYNVKLNDKVYINKNSWGKPPDITLKNPTYTLGQILYGVIWELSYFGSPDMVQKQSEELRKRVEDIKNDTNKENYITLDELLEKVKSKKKDKK